MHRGSCLCGAVGYEIDELPGPAVCCHCHSCRKSHGSAFKVGTMVETKHFRWTGDAEARRAFESSPGKQRYFCGTCGCHLASIRDALGTVALALGTLDTDPGFGPVAHIWTSDKADWFDPDPRLHDFPEAAPPPA